jgi:RND family efflux transporter MFP subunit
VIQRKTLFLGSMAVVVLAGLVVQQTGMLRERFGPENPPPRSVQAAESQQAPGRTARVERVTLPVLGRAVGTIAARSPAAVSARVMASLTQVVPQVGERVQEGALVAVLDDRDLQARVDVANAGVVAAQAATAAAEAELARAHAENTRASSERDRVQRLFDRDAATARQLEAAVAGANAAAASVSAAEAAVASARAASEAAQRRHAEALVQLGFARVSAPRAGVVASRELEPGELAMPGHTIVTIYDPGDLRIEAAVPESEVAGLAVGDEVRVTVPGAGLDLRAKIEEIQPLADPSSRSVLVKAPLAAAPALRPGLFARMEYPLATREAAVVPAACVRHFGQVESVRVLREDGSVATRHVRTRGLEGEERVEVLSGLSVGEEVVLEGE